jgi:hypothetical protein
MLSLSPRSAQRPESIHAFVRRAPELRHFLRLELERLLAQAARHGAQQRD